MKITNEKYKNLNLANEGVRGDNLIIDFIISSVIGLSISFLTFKSYTMALLCYLLVKFLYYFCFEYFFGRTPGKYHTQSKVVNKDGGKPTTTQLIIRNLSRFFSVLSGVSDDERAVHDILSNTFVIHSLDLKKIGFKKNLIFIFIFSYAGVRIFDINSITEFNTIGLVLLISLGLSVIITLIRNKTK